MFLSVGHRTCSSTMLLVVSYGIYPVFNVLVFLIMDPLQKLVLAPGVTIRDNTVLEIYTKNGQNIDRRNTGLHTSFFPKEIELEVLGVVSR